MASLSAPHGRRIVVVQAEGPDGHRDLVVPVAAVPYHAGDRRFVAVAVRLGLDFVGARGELLRLARPRRDETPWVDRPSRFATAPEAEVDYASDFVPGKSGVDVNVVGHASSVAPTETLDGFVGVLDAEGESVMRVGFHVRAGAPATRLPLVAPYLAPLRAGAVTRLGPSVAGRPALEGRFDGAPELESFDSAVPAARLPRGALASVGGLELAHLGGHGSLEAPAVVRFPELVPELAAELEGEEDLVVCPLALDTIWVDVDAGRAALVWRGVVGPIFDESFLKRLVLGMESHSAPRDWPTKRADTQRGKVSFAWFEDDAEKGEAPPSEGAWLEFHRYGTFSEPAPEPRVPLEEYARVSAEISERPADRTRTLSAIGHDEESWLVEERAWLERFAADAIDGSASLAALYGELFLQAQDALADPAEEQRWSLRDFAGLRAGLERDPEPQRVLDDAKVTLPQYMRLERRWLERADADPAVAEELERLTEEMLAEMPDPFGDEAEGGEDG